MNDMLRYSVSVKKGYRIFFGISSILLAALAVGVILLSAGKCETAMNYIFVTGGVMVFAGAALSCVYSITKKVLVYRGEIVYRTLFQTKEFKMSDICISKTQNSHVDYGEVVGYADDKVTTFYTKTGKKLFKFGLAYENVGRLQQDVSNTQKSIAGIKGKRRI